MRAVSKNSPAAKGYNSAVFVLLFIWLSHQAAASLAAIEGDSYQHHCSSSGCSLRRLTKEEEKTGGVEGGKWKGTQTGSGCNFLRKLSEPFLVWPIRWNEVERKEKEQGDASEKAPVHTRTSKGSYYTAWTVNKWGTDRSWEKKSVNGSGWKGFACTFCQHQLSDWVFRHHRVQWLWDRYNTNNRNEVKVVILLLFQKF